MSEMQHKPFRAFADYGAAGAEKPEMVYSERDYSELKAAHDALLAERERAWLHIETEFDIEPRAQMEAEAKTNGFGYGLAQAIHTIWKRDANVQKLTAEVARLTDALHEVGIELAQAQDAMHGQDYDAVDKVRETVRKHLKQSTK